MFTAIFFTVLIVFTTFMSLNLGGLYIILWVILGILLGYLAVFIVLVAHGLILYKVPVTSKYKNYGFRSLAYFLGNFTFNVGIKYVGRENVPMDGNLVVYANHKSYLDPVMMIQAIKRPSGFTPKSSLFKIPLMGPLMLSMGCMPIYRGDDRKTAKALIESIKNVSNGFTMVVFPEGGRKNRDTDEVKETRAGAFKMAVKPKASILPVTINGNSQIQHNAPFRRTKVTVVIHKPIHYDEYKHLTTLEIADMVSDIINKGIIK